MLVNPSPDDWLMYSRTYDAQRFSPLKQITTAQRRPAQEVVQEGAGRGHAREHSDRVSRRACTCMLAGRDGAGARRRHRRHDLGVQARPAAARAPRRSRFTTTWSFTRRPTASIVALDARTGDVRWETKTPGGATAGVDRRRGQGADRAAPARRRATNCYVAAHDAKTGKEVWRFYTAAGDTSPAARPGAARPDERACASTWGLPGGYDPVSAAGLLGHCQPDAEHARRPARRQRRRDSDVQRRRISTATPRSRSIPTPASWRWYYQHLPGDDWDEDYHARAHAAARPRSIPDPKFVKWINPDVRAASSATLR